MAEDVVRLRCSCGKMRGSISGLRTEGGNRVVCHCDDCQAFAKELERDDVLDGHGGTDIFQVRPAQIRIDQGGAELSCLRLKAGGLLRWYTACCNTPVGNMMAAPKMPFVGLIHSVIDDDGDAARRDQLLGPVRCRIHGKFAVGDAGRLEAHPTAPPSLLLRTLRWLIGGWLKKRYAPSPFFDANGKPIAVPRVVSG